VEGVWFLTSVCLCVCLSVFPHDISKSDAAKITKLDREMFHDESWKFVYFGVKRSKVKVKSRKNIASMDLHFCEYAYWLLL